MHALVDRILRTAPFQERPPICIDIGASGGLPSDWRLLAPHSICVAFDADDRDFTVTQVEGGPWKRLVRLNRLVVPKTAGPVDFFLTQSPHCSSSLEPDVEALSAWSFNSLFAVERKVSLPAVGLWESLRELDITYVDWFKTDSQGTDLRLLASLPASVIDQLAVAEFEPGIIDAYRGEDKLFAVMSFMDARPFFVSDMRVLGSYRIGATGLRALGAVQRRHVDAILKRSPGWAEIAYLNTYSGADRSPRDLLLGWICASIMEQDGHALAIAEQGQARFGDALFDECRAVSLGRFRARHPRLVVRVLKRGLSRLLRR